MSRPPSLPPVRGDSPAMDRWIKAVTQHLEILEGRSGDPTLQAVTQAVFDATSRELKAGIDKIGNRSPEEFARTIQNTAAFKELRAKIGQYDELSSSVRETVRAMVNEVRSALGANITQVQLKTQSDIDSLAVRLDSVQSGLGDSLASVRELAVASSNYLTSVATKVTTVEATLGSGTIDAADIMPTVYDDLAALQTAVPTGAWGKYYKVKDPTGPDTKPNLLYYWDGAAYVLGGVGTTATVEQKFSALVDRATGAEARASLKLNANGHVAGFEVTANDTTGSSFIIQADKFAIVASSGGTNYVPLGVDASGVYINGTLRVGSSAGPSLTDITYTNKIYLTYDTQYFKYNASGTLLNSTIALTANLTGALTGYVNWSAVGYTGTLPTDNTTLSMTVQSANVTGESATFTITKVADGVTYTHTVTVAKLRDGSSGSTGPRGQLTVSSPSFNIYSYFGGDSSVFLWNDSVANFVVNCAVGASTKPSSPTGYYSVSGADGASTNNKLGDVVTLVGPSNTNVKGSLTKTWDGSSWITFSQVIDGNLLVNGTVVADSIKTDVITASMIRADAIETNKISNLNVTTAKLGYNAATDITNSVRTYGFNMTSTSDLYYPASATSSNTTPTYATLSDAATAGYISISADNDHAALIALALNITTSGCTADQSNVLEYRIKVLWPGRSWSSWSATSRSDSGAVRLNYAYGRIVLPSTGTEFATVTPSISVLSGANQILVELSRPALGGTMTYLNSSVITVLDFKR